MIYFLVISMPKLATKNNLNNKHNGQKRLKLQKQWRKIGRLLYDHNKLFIGGTKCPPKVIQQSSISIPEH